MDGLFDIGPPAPADPPGGGTLAGNTHASAPLAVRMRPRTLDELVGQQHLLATGSPLRRLIEGDQPMSLLLWGPPGTGKTTIASIFSQQTNRRFVEVSAVAATGCGSRVTSPARSTHRPAAGSAPGARSRRRSAPRSSRH